MCSRKVSVFYDSKNVKSKIHKTPSSLFRLFISLFLRWRWWWWLWWWWWRRRRRRRLSQYFMRAEMLANNSGIQMSLSWPWNWRHYSPAKCMKLLCGNKMPTRCKRGFYCRSYCFLNMFRAPLCPSSGAQEYYTVVAPHQTNNLKTTEPSTTGSNHCIILLSSWWWA